MASNARTEPPPNAGPAPYRGLMPYEEADEAFFFGRNREREIIAANLLAARLTVLYGESGVGKSSVLHAGVVPHLRRVARELCDEGQTPDALVLVFNAWRDDPINGLQHALQAAARREWKEPVLPEPPSGAAFVETIEHWTRLLDCDLLLILDQFEEYFLYHPYEDGPLTFAVQFPQAVNRPGLRVHFIIAVREDALARLDRFKGRIPNLFRNYLRIEALDREAAQSAIEGPLAELRRQLGDTQGPVAIEPALIDKVIEQVRKDRVNREGPAGSGPAAADVSASSGPDIRIEAPYLQLVMTRLWREERRLGSDRLRVKTLEALGGADQIIRNHLDDTLQALTPTQQALAVRVFHQLVTPSGSKIAHTIADLAQYAEQPEVTVRNLLEHLCGAEIRILHPLQLPPGESPAVRYEITHNILGPAILRWRQIYLQREAQALQQQRVRRRQRIVLTVAGAIFVIATLLALWFVRQELSFADEQKAQADSMRKKANVEMRNAEDIQTLNEHINEGNEALQAKEWTRAQKEFNFAWHRLERLRRGDPQNAQWQRNAFEIQEKIGDTAFLQGNLETASQAYQTAVEQAAQVQQADPTAAPPAPQMGALYRKLGEVAIEGEKFEQADAAFSAAQQMTAPNAPEAPRGSENPRELVLSYLKLGNVMKQGGDLDAAADAYQRVVDIAKPKLGESPSDLFWVQQLIQAYYRLGDVELLRGNVHNAHSAHQNARDLAAAQKEQHPNDPAWRQQVALSESRLGAVAQAQGNLTEALQAYQRAIVQTAELETVDPENRKWQRQTATLYDQVKDVAIKKGDLPMARKAMERAQQRRSESEQPQQKKTLRSPSSLPKGAGGDVPKTPGDAPTAN